MKIIFFRSVSKKNFSSRIKINIERFLFNAFVSLFIGLLLIQVILANPYTRKVLIIDTALEGKPLSSEEYLYSTGEITIEAASSFQQGTLKVLINGEDCLDFKDRQMKLNLKNGDVVEIDGSMLKNPIDVRIISKSENIKSDCVGLSVRAFTDIKKLVKVKVE